MKITVTYYATINGLVHPSCQNRCTLLGIVTKKNSGIIVTPAIAEVLVH
jgi:hypothetical protein